MNKYHAKPVVIDGIRFASTGEGQRYLELKLLQAAGEIRGLVCHPRFTLFKSCTVNGEKLRPINYTGDFAYYEGFQYVVEDFKGGKVTEAAALRIALFKRVFPSVDFRIVRKNDTSRRIHMIPGKPSDWIPSEPGEHDYFVSVQEIACNEPGIVKVDMSCESGEVVG